jgi:hypothetical protein
MDDGTGRASRSFTLVAFIAWGVGMSSAEEYRRHAAGCILLAEETPNSAHRLALTEMAQSWLRLATQAEKNSRSNLVYETPASPSLRPQ